METTLAPFDGAESAFSKQDIHEAHAADRLIPKGHLRIIRIAMGHGIPDGDTMTVEDAHGEGSLASQDIFPSLRVRREQPGDIILASRDLEHGPIAKNETGGEKALGGGAIMIVPFIRALNAAGCAITNATEEGPLKRYVLGEPGLPRGPK